MDYSKTVNLPKTDFPMKANLSQREPQMLKAWEAEGIYGRILESRTGADDYILHDGPPYANGNIHLGHALNKVLKDIIVKHKTMIGFKAPYVPGWDFPKLNPNVHLTNHFGLVTDFLSECWTKLRAGSRVAAISAARDTSLEAITAPVLATTASTCGFSS